MKKMVRTASGAKSVKPVKNRTAGGRPPKNSIAQAKAGTSASIKVPGARSFNKVGNPVVQASKNLNSVVPAKKGSGGGGSTPKTPGSMKNFFKDANAGTSAHPKRPSQTTP